MTLLIDMKKNIQIAIRLVITVAIITGILYPITVTIIGQLVFKNKANGSLIMRDGVIIGSELIGQNFKGNKYFWGRPSATMPNAYNATHSSGSNLGPTNAMLINRINKRIKQLGAYNRLDTNKIPIDLITSSASGLDPEISVESALFQAPRIAAVRNIEIKKIYDLIDQLKISDDWNIFGISRINVLQLNLAVDSLQGSST